MALIGQLDPAQIGECRKVHLPGESPWADVIAVYSDGTWDGKIANTLFAEMPESDRQQVWAGESLPRLHDFHRNQVVRFNRELGDGWEIWVPAERAGGNA